MFDILNILRLLQAVIVVLGLVIIFFGTKSYRRTKSGSMLYMVIGFFSVTVGAVASGLLFELLNYDLPIVDTVGAAFEVLGYSLIVYSIVWARS